MRYLNLSEKQKTQSSVNTRRYSGQRRETSHRDSRKHRAASTHEDTEEKEGKQATAKLSILLMDIRR